MRKPISVIILLLFIMLLSSCTKGTATSKVLMGFDFDEENYQTLYYGDNEFFELVTIPFPIDIEMEYWQGVNDDDESEEEITRHNQVTIWSDGIGDQTLEEYLFDYFDTNWTLIETKTTLQGIDRTYYHNNDGVVIYIEVIDSDQVELFLDYVFEFTTEYIALADTDFDSIEDFRDYVVERCPNCSATNIDDGAFQYTLFGYNLRVYNSMVINDVQYFTTEAVIEE